MSEQSNTPKKNYLIEDYQPFKSVNWSGECEHIERDKNMNQSKTPRSTSIRDNIHVAMVADNREQSISHLEEAHREIESMERELTAVTEQREEVSETLKSLTTTAFDLLASFGRAREERDRLAEALDRITISGCGILCRQIANEALQSLTTNAERIHGDAGAGKPRETLPPLDDASC